MAWSTGTQVGGYEIINLLGVGGMGEVYRARNVRLQRDVALKVLQAIALGALQEDLSLPSFASGR